jgi:phospholipid/cholesterol/gamma-HCH transport system substrate-binding protein
VPYLGVPAAPAVRASSAADQPLGPANSPQENDLVNELLAPAAKKRPGDLPDWSSLLAGPAFRGAEVTLR